MIIWDKRICVYGTGKELRDEELDLVCDIANKLWKKYGGLFLIELERALLDDRALKVTIDED